MPKKSSLIVAVVVIAVVIAVLVGGALLGLPFDFAPVTANTSTQTYNVAGGFVGTGSPSYGGTAAPQMLDQTDYIASWSYNLNGQRITAVGGVVIPSLNVLAPCGIGLSGSSATWGYRFWIYVPGSTPISGWNQVIPSGLPRTDLSSVSDFPDPNTQAGKGTIFSEPIPSGQGTAGTTIYAPPVYWDMASPDGSTVIPEGSVIHVEFWGFIGCVSNFGLTTSAKWYELASDEARIHTGIGSVNFDRQPALYGLGDTATCSWTVGYVSDPQKGLGWKIFLTSSGQGNQTVASIASISTLNGGLTYKITAADLAGSRNKIYCNLFNNLFSKDFAVSAIVWCTGCGPSITVTGISPQTPKQGGTVTVSWTDAPNPATRRNISSVEVVYGWGGPQTDVMLPGNATSYSFVASQAGFLNFAVAAWDTGGNSSGFVNLKISVNPQAANGGLAGGGPGTAGPGIVIGLALLVVGILLVALAAYDMIPIEWLRFLILAVGVVLAIVGAWIFATALWALISGALPFAAVTP